MDTSTQTSNDNGQEHRATRAMELLDRWADRLSGHHTQRRGYPRKTLRAQITIYVPEDNKIAGECNDSASFQAWTRNISSNGVSFLYSRYVKLETFIICLETGKRPIWFNAELIRCRQVHEGFWEYGARLTGRAAM